MHPSRTLGRSVLAVVSAALIVACAGTPSRSADVAVGSASPAPSRAPSPVATASPSPSSAAVPSSSPSAIVIEPSDPPEASTEPASTAPPTPKPLPSPTAAADCGTGEAGYAAATDGPPDSLAYGHSTVPFTGAAFGLIDGSYRGDDLIPAGAGIDPRQIAVRVAPGDHVIVRAQDLTISHISATVVDWSTLKVVNGLGSWSGTPVALGWRYRSDGSISLDSPTTPGDYLVLLDVGWFGSCRTGDGVAYGHLKVVAQ